MRHPIVPSIKSEQDALSLIDWDAKLDKLEIIYQKQEFENTQVRNMHGYVIGVLGKEYLVSNGVVFVPYEESHVFEKAPIPSPDLLNRIPTYFDTIDQLIMTPIRNGQKIEDLQIVSLFHSTITLKNQLELTEQIMNAKYESAINIFDEKIKEGKFNTADLVLNLALFNDLKWPDWILEKMFGPEKAVEVQTKITEEFKLKMQREEKEEARKAREERQQKVKDRNQEFQNSRKNPKKKKAAIRSRINLSERAMARRQQISPNFGRRMSYRYESHRRQNRQNEADSRMSALVEQMSRSCRILPERSIYHHRN